jgi:hypothetical protein
MKRPLVIFALLIVILAFAGAMVWARDAQAEPPAPLVHPGQRSSTGQAASVLSLTKTVGTNPAVCATTSDITVAPDTHVTYCYKVTNGTPITLTRHTLVDSELGTILSSLPYALAPQASAFLTQTALIAETTTNRATWTAYNPGPVDVHEASDSATVTVQPPTIALSKTVGVNPAVCATTSEITVEPNTAVTYCYQVTNTGAITLTRHTLVDSELGTILSDLPYALAPQASVFLTQTALIAETTTNTATWTAFNPGPIHVATGVDSATVNAAFELFLPLILRQ